MQSRRSPHSDGLKKPAPPAKRAQTAREAVLRVTQELLQSHAPSHKENLPDDEHIVESAQVQGANENMAEQKTRLLNAIQPVLEVVADSALRNSDASGVQQ